MGAAHSHVQRNHARVRMVARPASVPSARRFVDETLTGWGHQALVDDIGLCVTELSTNATLHSGSTFFEVELQRLADAVRIAVRDAGQESADSLAASSELADALLEGLTADDAATTGRGIFIVSLLASSWGIDELPDGKRVWAEFVPDGAPYDAEPPEITRRPEPPAEQSLDGDHWVVVRFQGCPAALLLAHDDNLADIIRELQLIGSDPNHRELERLAQLMAGHVRRHAVNWDAARIQAREAVRTGREVADIHVLTSRDVMTEVRFLRRLVSEAEALAESGRLMTLPAPPEVQRVRDWLESEFRSQAEEGCDPVPYATWLARRARRAGSGRRG